MSTGGSKKAILAALFANLGIAMAKLIGFIVTGAASMLAEAIHSAADTGNQLLLILGGRKAAREPDSVHQFGYGRERYFWAFVVAIVLFSVGGMFSIYEGINKIRHPHELEDPAWAIGILVVAIILESISFRTAIHEAKPHRGRATWSQFIRRTKSPELPVVLLEDLAALIGLILALGAVSASAITGNALWDAFGTVTIGLLLVCVATVLGIEMKSLLIGESADPDVQKEIQDAVVASDRVIALINLRSEHIGPEELLVAAKVHFDESLSIRELATVIDQLEANVRSRVPSVTRLFVEPDVILSGHAPQGA